MARRRHVLVIGLEAFGRAVAEGVMQAGGEVLAVDTEMARVEAVRDRVTVAAHLDAIDEPGLEAVGVREVDVAVVAIRDDFATSVLAVALLRELGVGRVVARARDERERRILELVGATRTVMVEAEMGQRLARALVATDVLDAVALGGGVSLIQWTADERVIGRTPAQTDLATRWQLHLVAVRPAGQERAEIPPAPDRAFAAGDVLVLLGDDRRLAAFAA